MAHWRNLANTIELVLLLAHGPSENIRPLANESVKHCINGVVQATLLSAADIGCFQLSINHVRLQPARFIGHQATMWSANHREHDARAASALLIGLCMEWGFLPKQVKYNPFVTFSCSVLSFFPRSNAQLEPRG